MNAISKAVDECKYRIDNRILNAAFIDTEDSNVSKYLNLDEQIINKVVRPRVLVDCNIVGGVEILVPLNGLPIVNPDMNSAIISIPKDRTQGRSITSVLSVLYTENNYYANGIYDNTNSWRRQNTNSTPISVANTMLNAMSDAPVVSSSRCELINENTILIRDNNIVTRFTFIRCIISNDDELSNLPITAYRAFSDLVEFAVKAYIYNTLYVAIDVAQLHGGVQLGSIKEIISTYADSELNYRTHLKEVWSKVAFLSDGLNRTRYYNLLLGAQR